MAVNWHNLAISAACYLEHERICNRRAFIDEASLVRAAAQFIQATTQLLLDPEYNHPDLPGTSRLDLLARTRPDVPATLLAEAKWIKAGGGTRQWAVEISKDILRLEGIRREVTPATDRALIVGGIRRSLDAKLLDVTVQAGGGDARVQVLPHILQERKHDEDYPYNQTRIPIRECDNGMRRFWSSRSNDLNINLPVSYQVSLAGHHIAGPTQDSVEVFVWLIKRSRNRSDFNPERQFGGV